MKTYIIAEAGVNHNGRLDLAKKLVDVACECGADAVKFQTFKAEESTGITAPKSMYQRNNSSVLESQYEMIKKLELPFSYFAQLKTYCEMRHIDFISTPDGTESLRCLLELDVPLIKIGSSEITNHLFLREIAESGKALILSTGMSSLGEVEKAVTTILEAGNENLRLMHCTTDYPTAPGDVNLRAMVTMQKAFSLPVGYSDHTVGFEAAIVAVALGAVCIEKHITLDRKMSGPDHKASMPPEEFRDYVQHIRNAEILMGSGRKRPTLNEREIMKQARRSILTVSDLPAGTILTSEMLCYKRPGTGIAPEYADLVIGRQLKRNMAKEEVIRWEDI